MLKNSQRVSISSNHRGEQCTRTVRVWPLSALALVRPRTHITVLKLAARLCCQIVDPDTAVRGTATMRVAFHNVIPAQRVCGGIEQEAVQATHCPFGAQTRILNRISPILGVDYDCVYCSHHLCWIYHLVGRAWTSASRGVIVGLVFSALAVTVTIDGPSAAEFCVWVVNGALGTASVCAPRIDINIRTLAAHEVLSIHIRLTVEASMLLGTKARTFWHSCRRCRECGRRRRWRRWCGRRWVKI